MKQNKDIQAFNEYIQEAREVFFAVRDTAKDNLGEKDDLGFIQGQHWFHLTYLSHLLWKESKLLGRLTVALIFLTFVLLILTAWNVWLLIR